MVVIILFLGVIFGINTKILFVYEHCRHGARSMTHLYENDTDIIGERWPGEGELSYVGIRQHYLLGVRNKNRYKDLLNYSQYSPDEILVYSTNSNRTIMSAQAQLFGMYHGQNTKLTENQQKSAKLPFKLDSETEKKIQEKEKELGHNALPSNIPTQIPIHIIDTRMRLMQFEKKGGCPEIKNIRKNNEKKNEVKEFCQKFNKTYGEELLKLYKKNASESDFYADYDNVFDILNGFKINYVDGRKMQWFLGTGKFKVIELLSMGKSLSEIQSKVVQSGDELALSSSSVMMRWVLNYMDKAIEQDKNEKKSNEKTPKFLLVSAHDGTLISIEDILRYLYKVEIQPPAFAANIFFELIKEEQTGKYQVELIFNDITLTKLDYDEFKNAIEDQTWTLEKTGIYCGFIKRNIKSWKLITIVFGAISIFGIILLAFAQFKMFKKDTLLDE